MANRPTHSAFIVIDPPEGSDRDAKARWIEIAPLWPHKDGQGYDLLVPQGISIGGRVVIRERRTDQD